MAKNKILKGDVFGELTIIDVDRKRWLKEKERLLKGEIKCLAKFWICKCSCGKILTVRTSHLISRPKISCGHPYVKNLEGSRFGRLVVIEEDLGKEEKYSDIHKSSSNGRRWICKCDCGNFNSVYSHHLLSENGTKSCGCLAIEVSKKYNTYEEKEDHYIGWDTKHENFFMISKEDYENVKNYCWKMDRSLYWDTNRSKKLMSFNKLHQLICKNIYGEYNTREIFVDHIDRNPSNNKRDNLRLVTSTENMRNRTKPLNNTSGKMGVSFNKKSKKYEAYITIDRKRIGLGMYHTFEEAVEARQQAEKEYGFIGE